MDTQVVAIFYFCDDTLKAIHHYKDPQCQMTDAEVLTIAIVATLHYRYNFEDARKFLKGEGYFPHMLGKSRFNRRIHRFQTPFLTLLRLLGETWKNLNDPSVYVIESHPIASCDNYRILRFRHYRGEAWRGYQPSRRRYFYGLKIHIMVIDHEQPVEFFLTMPGLSATRLTLNMLSKAR